MNYVRKPSNAKRLFKCFQCRETTKSLDGTWHEIQDQQVFLCKPCQQTQAAKDIAARKLA